MEVHPEWEEGYFYTATYYDKVMSALTDVDKRGDFVAQVRTA